MPRNRSKRLDKYRVIIGAKLRELRDSRLWTQAELGRRLDLSQTRLSNIERGTASLSAEQLLEVLRLFNVPITEFVTNQVGDPLLALQNTLARLGAGNLHVSDRVVPSERLARVNDVIVEALKSRSPRLITALAPVLVNNADALNVNKLSVDLDDFGLRRRLYWLIENTQEAIRIDSEGHRRSNNYIRASRRLESAMSFATGYEQMLEGMPEDNLDPSIRSGLTVDQVRRTSSEISKKWGVISSLQPEHFAAALRDARAVD